MHPPRPRHVASQLPAAAHPSALYCEPWQGHMNLFSACRHSRGGEQQQLSAPHGAAECTAWSSAAAWYCMQQQQHGGLVLYTASGGQGGVCPPSRCRPPVHTAAQQLPHAPVLENDKALASRDAPCSRARRSPGGCKPRSGRTSQSGPRWSQSGRWHHPAARRGHSTRSVSVSSRA